MHAARRLLEGDALPTEAEQAREVTRRVLSAVGPRPIRVQRLPQEELIPLIDEAINYTLHPPQDGSSRELLRGSSRSLLHSGSGRSLVSSDELPSGAGEPPPLARRQSSGQSSGQESGKLVATAASRAPPVPLIRTSGGPDAPPPPSPELQSSPPPARRPDQSGAPPPPSLDMML